MALLLGLMMLGNLKFSVASLRACACLGLMLLFSACVSNVTVKGEVPQPLVKRLPITGKLIYTDAFKKYTYQEAEKSRSLKSLDFSEAQINLFDTIFGSLLTLLPAGVPASEQSVDLIIEPEVLDFQYTAPRETKLNLYEVWLKYRLKLTAKDGEQLADWIIKGYGKTPTAMLTSASTAFTLATNVALRDVGAQLAIRFPKQSSVKGLLSTYENIEIAPEGLEANSQAVADKAISASANDTGNEGDEDE